MAARVSNRTSLRMTKLEADRRGARSEVLLHSGLVPAGVVLGYIFDPVLVRHRQKHIGGALHVVGEYDVAIALEASVDAADQNHRDLLVRVAVRVAHVA